MQIDESCYSVIQSAVGVVNEGNDSESSLCLSRDRVVDQSSLPCVGVCPYVGLDSHSVIDVEAY